MSPERCAKLDATLTQLYALLPYVARDAERLRNPTELVQKSYELHMASRAIEETLPHPSLAGGVPVIRVCIGNKAVEALGMRKNAYDLLETSLEIVHPCEEIDLRFMHRVSTDIFNTAHTQPVFGQGRYFDLATLGRSLEDGGELTISE